MQWLGLNLLIKIGWRNRMGKGSKRRKGDNQKQYAENWEKIFGKKGVDDLLDAYSKVLEKHLPNAEKKEKKKDA